MQWFSCSEAEVCFFCSFLGGGFLVLFCTGQNEPKTFYQTMAEGDETLPVLEWVFLLSCFLVTLWNQHVLSITFIENA